MLVDFSLAHAPAYRVAAIVRIGPWREDNLRTEFGELVAWARRQKVRTGKWIFYERGHHRWEACLEYRGRAAAEGRIRLKTLPAADVARVTFNPDLVSSRLVYHGLNDWTRWRRKDKEIRSVSGIREVYAGDPWQSRAAWTRCQVEYVVRR
jgi:DNA gyrase inhibitor GyrI